MMSPDLERGTFERAVVLLALAVAYRIRMEELINQLSECNLKANALSRVAQCALAFNAQCYFRHPVKLEYTELPLIWDGIAERFRLEQRDAELTQQAHVLYELVAGLERDREQRRWQWLAFALAIISSLQVLTLFPEQTRHAWWNAFRSWLAGI